MCNLRKNLKTKIMKKQISILGMAFIGCTLLMTSCKKPAASFTADKSSVMVGEAVNFTNGTTDAAKQTWDFGDGTQSTSTGATVSHVYNRPGAYTVSLLGTKKNGKKQSDAPTVTITVIAPTADFTVSNAMPAAGEAVTFTSTSTGGAEEFVWNFGDGVDQQDNGAVQSHTYSMGGTYTATLTVYGPNHTAPMTKSMDITVGGLSGNNVNWAMLVGKWNYTSKVVKDERNGTTYTNTSSSSLPSVMYNWSTSTSTAFTTEFSSDGSVIFKDINGNYNGGGGAGAGSYDIIDATRMTSSALPGTGSYGMGVSIGTYSVSATSFTLTYVSTSTLPSYYDGSVTHPAGEKQVVTTTYTFTK
jgi:PKD repeat protein